MGTYQLTHLGALTRFASLGAIFFVYITRYAPVKIKHEYAQTSRNNSVREDVEDLQMNPINKCPPISDFLDLRLLN